MPPTMGAAIRRMTSAPVPVAQRMGNRAMKVVATVIALGRIRWTAPWSTASARSAQVVIFPSLFHRS